MAATGGLVGTGETVRRDVKGKDPCLSFLPKDGTLDRYGVLGYHFCFGTCLNKTSRSQFTHHFLYT